MTATSSSIRLLHATLPFFLTMTLVLPTRLAGQSYGTNGPIAEARHTLKLVNEIFVRQDVTTHAKEYLGLKYRKAGNSPSTGFDCSGFICFLLREYDYRLPRTSAVQEKEGLEISREEARPGDLVFFRHSKAGRVFHVAMVVDNQDGDLHIIHSTSRGIVIDRLQDSAYWRAKVITLRDVISDKKN
ncbi:MAG: hypothetical protein RLY31_1326 [Bacteroidota bacterium]|jgi:cell wall-associated NlpC family hydrolase